MGGGGVALNTPGAPADHIIYIYINSINSIIYIITAKTCVRLWMIS